MRHKILIRILGKEGRINNKSNSSTNSQRFYLRSIARLSELELSPTVADKIKEFWHGIDKSRLIESEDRPSGNRILVERIGERRSLIIFGAGHVGRSIALMGVMLGLEVSLFDDRADFLRKEDLPVDGIQFLQGDFNKIGDSITLDRYSSVVIVTRGHQFDEVILRQLASCEAGYIGMIGSRRRIEGIFRRLRGEGCDESFLRSVKAPIGLDIGAVTPQEIAISVHAEIISYYREERCVKTG